MNNACQSYGASRHPKGVGGKAIWFVSGRTLLIWWLCSCSNLAGADPHELLSRAEKLTDLYNWYDAQPLYAEAEAGFRAEGDERDALYAEVSRLRGEMQIRPFPELIDAIDDILAKDVSKIDKPLRLRCFIVR